MHGTMYKPVLSIRLAVFTVSPNKQYRGIVNPTTPAQQGPMQMLNECKYTSLHAQIVMKCVYDKAN